MKFEVWELRTVDLGSRQNSNNNKNLLLWLLASKIKIFGTPKA